MAEEPDNLVLHYLRRLDAKVDRMAEDLHDIKVRLTTHVEEGLAGINRRLDRLELRVDHIEKRLEIVGPYGGVHE
jgi:hypothetical protein